MKTLLTAAIATLDNRLGLHKAILSAQAADGRRKFGIKNRGQAHGWNFGKAEPKPTETRKGGALAETAMSRLKARLANQIPLPVTKGEARTTFPSVNRTNGSKTSLT